MGDCLWRNHYSILLLTHRQVVKSKIDTYVIDRVKEKRLERNFSQADLAYELGMSIGFIGKVESPKYPAHYNVKHLNDLAKILKCSPQDFLPKKPLT
jgi:transcriptional regulator with XRE-family HTH domain